MDSTKLGHNWPNACLGHVSTIFPSSTSWLSRKIYSEVDEFGGILSSTFTFHEFTSERASQAQRGLFCHSKLSQLQIYKEC